MKTIYELKSEYGESCDVFTFKEFWHLVDYYKCINSFDGDGFYHDGIGETNISVWGFPRSKASTMFPYVIWYNK